MLALMPGPPGDLVRSELGLALGEHVENGHRALDGGDMANCWLTGARHATVDPAQF